MKKERGTNNKLILFFAFILGIVAGIFLCLVFLNTKENSIKSKKVVSQLPDQYRVRSWDYPIRLDLSLPPDWSIEYGLIKSKGHCLSVSVLRKDLQEWENDIKVYTSYNYRGSEVVFNQGYFEDDVETITVLHPGPSPVEARIIYAQKGSNIYQIQANYEYLNRGMTLSTQEKKYCDLKMSELDQVVKSIHLD